MPPLNMFTPVVPEEVAEMLKLPFIAKMGIGGVLLPPHPARRKPSVAIKPDRSVAERKRSQYLDKSGMRPRDVRHRKVRCSRM
jgi:hypothetical protein